MLFVMKKIDIILKQLKRGDISLKTAKENILNLHKNKEIACPECGCDDMIDYENHFKRCNKCDYIWRKF